MQLVFDPAAVAVTRLDGEIISTRACEASIVMLDESAVRVLVVQDDGAELEVTLAVAAVAVELDAEAAA